MDGLERQQFIREQRERILAEARATVDRLRNIERPIGDPIDPLAERKAAEAEAQERHAPGMVYKTIDDAIPAAPMPAPDTTDGRITDEQEFIFAVVREALAELEACHRAEIQSLKDEVADLKRAFFNLPDGMLAASRELHAQTVRTLAAVADLHAASERDQQRRSDPLDLPALPLRRQN